jgi:hypothetical protein
MSMKSKLTTTALFALVAMSGLATTSANAFQVKTTFYCEDGPMFPSCGIQQIPQQARYYIPPPRHGGHIDTLPRPSTARDLEDKAMSYAGGGGGGGGGGGR